MSIEGRIPKVDQLGDVKLASIIPGIIVSECPPMPASGPPGESQTVPCTRQLTHSTHSGYSGKGTRVSASASRSKHLTVGQVAVLERAFKNDHNPTHAQECLVANHLNV